MKHDEIVYQYRKEFEKPLAGIREDPFLRADNFREEAWYDEFLLYTRIGGCRPAPEHILEVQKALKLMGYPTHTAEHEGKLYVLPGEEHGQRDSVKKLVTRERSDER